MSSGFALLQQMIKKRKDQAKKDRLRSLHKNKEPVFIPVQMDYYENIYDKDTSNEPLFLPKPIDGLPLSERTRNALTKKHNIFTTNKLGGLKDKSDAFILSMKGIGRKGLLEIRNAIKIIASDFPMAQKHGEEKEKQNEQIETGDVVRKVLRDVSYKYLSDEKGNNNASPMPLSIDALPFSERTRHALIDKHKIRTIHQLLSLQNESDSFFLGMKGIGRKGLLEIRNAIFKIKNGMFPGVDFNIQEKKWEELGDKLSRCQKYISEYIEFFLELKKIDLSRILLDFIENKTELEKDLFMYRLLFLSTKVKKTLEQIGKQYNLTRERIRQKEVQIKEKAGLYIESFFYGKIGKTARDSIIYQYGTKSFFVFPNGRIRKDADPSISDVFWVFAIKNILKYDYFSIDICNEEKKDKIMLVKNNLVNNNVISLFLTILEKKYNKERKEPLMINIEAFMLETLKKHHITYESTEKIFNNKYYIDIFKTYVLEKYNILSREGNIIFPINKKNISHLVMKELMTLDKSIHYSELFVILTEKYPQYKWKINSILSTLIAESDAINIGKGLYVYRRGSTSCEEGTIGDVAERFILNQKAKSALLQDVVNYIKEHKSFKEGSIRTMMFAMDKKNRFIRLPGKRVGLRGYNYDNTLF